MFPGMPRISSFLPPASAPVADVPTGVNGDGPGDNDEADAEDEDDADASPVSAWSPQPDFAEVFKSLVGLSSDTWEESKHLGPNVMPLLCRWSTPDSGFRPLRRDPCLHTVFEKFAKDNQPLYDFALTSTAMSITAAHATSHVAAFIGEFIQNLSFLPESAWESYCVEAERAISTDVLLPLRDVSWSLVALLRLFVLTLSMLMRRFNRCFGLQCPPLAFRQPYCSSNLVSQFGRHVIVGISSTSGSFPRLFPRCVAQMHLPHLLSPPRI